MRTLPPDKLVQHYRLAEPLFVTRPTMPSLADYSRLMEGLWENRQLTNKGPLHEELEHRLAVYLRATHLSLFCNGTIAMMLALRAFNVEGGNVITTPFTFPATPHVISWNGCQPVFCDIDPGNLNLDARHLPRLIDRDTRAILPVHVYGTPCDVEAIQDIADHHGIPVIYDAAHTFGVDYKDRSLTTYGDASILSFHATKMFSTAEGGAVVLRDPARKQTLEQLKNFGILDEETVAAPGINGKMNEFQAAFGLLQLDLIRDETAKRRELTMIYRRKLRQISGVRCLETPAKTRVNHAYFPVLIDAEDFGMDRDTLNGLLKSFNIFTRKYFHPLCSHYPHYKHLPSARAENLPIAEAMSRKVLCLPIYGTLEAGLVETVCDLIAELQLAA